MQPVSFRVRRNVSLLVTCVAVALVAGVTWLLYSRLAHESFFTGGILLATVLLLGLIGVRRRIPVLALGSMSTWTQVHAYMGLFTLGVYALHVPSLVAGGTFETGLSILFLVVAASGVYGIYASRTLPPRLTAVQGQHRFDHVHWHRHQIAEHAKELLDGLSEPSAVRVLGSFYTNYLSPFFSSSPSPAYLLAPSGMRRRRLLSGLQELDRYLETDGRSAAGKFAALVRRRDDLDYQYALQLRLRLWVLVHTVFSVALIAGGIVHAILVWRFAG